MKKLILILITINIFLYSYSQPINKPKFDIGYYSGICYDDSIKSKYTTYLYLQFLSNQTDSMLVIVPYNIKKSKISIINQYNEKIMNDTINNYLVKLSNAVTDIESFEIINHPWTINGFDNFTYYDLKNGNLSFSLNIANIETDSIEIFHFDGIVYKDEINAIVYSENGTFQKGEIKLKFIENIPKPIF